MFTNFFIFSFKWPTHSKSCPYNPMKKKKKKKKFTKILIKNRWHWIPNFHSHPLTSSSNLIRKALDEQTKLTKKLKFFVEFLQFFFFLFWCFRDWLRKMRSKMKFKLEFNWNLLFKIKTAKSGKWACSNFQTKFSLSLSFPFSLPLSPFDFRWICKFGKTLGF